MQLDFLRSCPAVELLCPAFHGIGLLCIGPCSWSAVRTLLRSLYMHRALHATTTVHEQLH